MCETCHVCHIPSPPMMWNWNIIYQSPWLHEDRRRHNQTQFEAVHAHCEVCMGHSSAVALVSSHYAPSSIPRRNNSTMVR